MDNRPIGIFDSGAGGLTAVRALEKLLPRESILFLGDTARMPYGNRTPEELADFARQDTGFLAARGVKAILAACGTVSSNVTGLERLLPIPYFNIIGATVEAAAKATRTGRVGLIATAATIRSGRFAAALEARLGSPIVAAPCPALASLVERGYGAEDAPVREAVGEAAPLFREAGIDVLVLGCTHYPLVAGAFTEALGAGVALIDSGGEAAAGAAKTLAEAGLLCAPDHAPEIHFYFTGDARETAKKAGALLYGRDISTRTEELPLGALTGGTP